jgi:oligoendopeptidase F
MSAAIAEQPTRADIPVEETWDLSSYYPSDADWEADLAAAPDLVAKAVAHRGNLGESAERLKQALDDINAASLTIDRLATYAHMRHDEDLGNAERQAAYDRAITMAIGASQQLAFFRPELLQLDAERFEALASDPALAGYAHTLEGIGRMRPYTRSIEVEELLAGSYDVARGVPDSFSALNDADLDFGVVKDDDGNDVKLTRGRYQLLLQSKNREFRSAAYDSLMTEYEGHLNSIASLHAASVRSDVFYSRARGYASARQAALYGNNIDESVYDALIQAVRENSPIIERFFSLRSRILGLDDLALYDVYVPLAPEPEAKYSISEAIDIVLKGVSALGQQYVDDLQMLFDKRVVDWHETQGKRSGAYSTSTYGSLPVMLMNWNGSMDHVYTLAHEAGHAMHSYYAMNAQPYHYADYTIFSAEIASTVNEVLLTWDLLRSLPEDALIERFSILDRFADTINGTLVRQTMFADYEYQTHRRAEAGEPLTRETLMEIYGSAAEIYRPGVLNDDRSRMEWCRVPHFYHAFYVYQYSTGISSAIALAKAIRDNGESSAERYLDMLRAGGSDYPVSLLQKAGVDPTTGEPFRAAMEVFGETIAEMEAVALKAGFLA